MDIIQMTTQAAMMITVIIIIRALGMAKLPKWSFQVLWGVALARLLLPIRIESPFSVYGIAQWFQTSSITTPPTGYTSADIVAPFNTSVMQLSDQTSAAASTAPLVSLWMIVWIMGAILLLGYVVLVHLHSRRTYQNAVLLSESRLSKLPFSRTLFVRTSANVEAPFTYGVVHPVILLPEHLCMAGEGLDYVIAHELAHARHWDTLKKWLLTISLCVHWFNPLVWAMYILANRDIELSCDESVVRSFGVQQKACYASVLIDMQEALNMRTPLANHFSKNAIEERIIAIMKYKKASLIGIILALVLVAGVTTALATNAVTAQSEPMNAVSTSGDTTYAYEEGEKDEGDMYDRYAPYGLIYNDADGRLYYNGESVRHFEDMYSVGDGGYAGITGTYKNGTVDVRAVRDLTQRQYNEDGSFDPSGVLLGLEQLSKAEFDANTMELNKPTSPPTAYASEGDALDGVDDAGKVDAGPSMYSIYEPYGMTYDSATDLLYMNGQMVRYFLDIMESNGESLTGGKFQGSMRNKNNSVGTVDVYAVRDEGNNLTGLRVASQQEFDERTQVWAKAGAVATETALGGMDEASSADAIAASQEDTVDMAGETIAEITTASSEE